MKNKKNDIKTKAKKAKNATNFILTLRSDEIDNKTLKNIKKCLSNKIPGRNPILGVALNDSVEIYQFKTSEDPKSIFKDQKTLILVIKSDDVPPTIVDSIEKQITRALPSHHVSVVNVGAKDNLDIVQVS